MRYDTSMITILTRNAKETQKVAAALAGEAAGSARDSALVLALEGELGSGKTTFAQGFARALGVKDKVLSPTFVLFKNYNIKRKGLKYLIHIDCYRLDSPQELSHLGFGDLLKDKDAIILVEWAEKIRRILPRDIIRISFRHGKRPNERLLTIEAGPL